MVQPTSAEVKQFHAAARSKLKHEFLRFSEHEITRIADSFARVSDGMPVSVTRLKPVTAGSGTSAHG